MPMMETPPFLICPQIFTTNLRRYTTIIGPRPLPPPTKPEIRSAIRCCRAGMVPGAIRKYLLHQKKKEEEEEAGEGGEEEDEDSNGVNNNHNVVEEEQQEVIRPPPPEEDEDEVKFIAFFPSPPISSPSAEESPETPSPAPAALVAAAAEGVNNPPRNAQEEYLAEGKNIDFCVVKTYYLNNRRWSSVWEEMLQ
jgi:hypothetical protein